ncbi:hypothetical protein HYC85_025290 [Camellia sinensis]|uniref:Uncharacterized protein n=1 Tax=Camellia sinensis TaxID=4442 RepID=A0A7J7GED8_CAMSI|nr:hypothetical protein HYC85_025290 [Camellia sinensis]
MGPHLWSNKLEAGQLQHLVKISNLTRFSLPVVTYKSLIYCCQLTCFVLYEPQMALWYRISFNRLKNQAFLGKNMKCGSRLRYYIRDTPKNSAHDVEELDRQVPLIDEMDTKVGNLTSNCLPIRSEILPHGRYWISEQIQQPPAIQNSETIMVSVVWMVSLHSM